MTQAGEILKDLGFDDREVKIYKALLKLSDASALQISKEANIDRTTTYDILDRLIGKGIVSYYLKNKSKKFKALAPKELLNHFKEKYTSLEQVLPELQKITQQTPEAVQCELFYGKEGLKSIGKDLVKISKEYRVIGIREEYEEILGYFNEQSILKLDRFRAKEIAIVEKEAKFKKLKHGVYRYLDKKLLSPVTTLIYKNKVVFFIWKEPYFAVSITSEHLVKAQKEYFNLLWQIAK